MVTLIFKLLESINLGETSVALHSLNLVGNRKQRSFELDFLVVTTNFILGLEVKAGKVESKDSVWIVYEHDRPWVESYRKKVSPFVQALNALDKFRTGWIPETFTGDRASMTKSLFRWHLCRTLNLIVVLKILLKCPHPVFYGKKIYSILIDLNAVE